MTAETRRRRSCDGGSDPGPVFPGAVLQKATPEIQGRDELLAITERRRRTSKHTSLASAAMKEAPAATKTIDAAVATD